MKIREQRGRWDIGHAARAPIALLRILGDLWMNGIGRYHKTVVISMIPPPSGLLPWGNHFGPGDRLAGASCI